MASELSAFTLPLLLVWLASPLLSLVDTASVGAFRTTAELAVLGPACALCDNAAFLCTFMGIVTTGAVSRAMAAADEKLAKQATGAAVWAALGVGGLLTALAFSDLGVGALACFLPRATPCFEGARTYVRVRALAFAPALLIMVLQSASLARRDVGAPLRASAYSGAANLLGDALLVPKYGLAGAAAATAAAQAVALWEMVRSTAKGGYAPGRLAEWRDCLGAPFRRLWVAGAPVIAALFSKTCVLLSLSYAATVAAAARGDFAALAAHQILVGLYFVFAPIGDALSQTVQTFLPRSVIEDAADAGLWPRAGRALGAKSKSVVKGALVAAATLGGLDAVCAAALPTCLPTLFSGDAAVHAALAKTAPYLGLSLAVHGLSSAAEGTMLATRDTAVLGGLYALDAAVVVAAFLACARRAAPLNAVWRTFLGYQLLRCTQFALRVGFTALRRQKPQPLPEALLATPDPPRTIDMRRPPPPAASSTPAPA